MYPGVDVRDVAFAHLQAIKIEDAKNQRILLVSESQWLSNFCAVMEKEFSPFGYKITS